MNKSLLIKVIIAVMICLTMGFLSGVATASNIEGWYSTLVKPSFNPPNWIFGPMWSLLYILMGISFGRIWYDNNNKKAIGLFIVQFVLNLAWTPVFFGMKNLPLSLGIIITLWILIAITIRAMRSNDKTAALLMVPYFLWVGFAMILNASIWQLN